MCGRVIQASPPDQLGLKIIDALDPRDNRVTGDPFGNVPPRYNGAPSQQLWVIRQNPQTGERSLDLLQWGLIPYWCKEKPKPPPINAKAETVDRLPMFREAYRKRRCILPIDGFFGPEGPAGEVRAAAHRKGCGRGCSHAALVGAVARGDLTPSEAGELARLVEGYVRAVEATDILDRLAKLEAATQRHTR